MNSWIIKFIGITLTISGLSAVAAVVSSDPETFVDPRFKVDFSNPNTAGLKSIGNLMVSAVHKNMPLGFNRKEDIDFYKSVPSNSILKNSGTGFLVGECIVLTNQHVVLGKDVASNIDEHSMIFEIPAIGVTTPAKILYIGGMGYKKLPDSELYNFDSTMKDWSLVMIKEPLGKQVGFFDIYYGPIEILKKAYMKVKNITTLDEKQEANLAAFHKYLTVPSEATFLKLDTASYYADKTPDMSQLWMQKKCRMNCFNSDYENRGCFSDCASVPGASGSPIFILNESVGMKYAFGMVALHRDFNKTTEYALSMNEAYTGSLHLKDSIPEDLLKKVRSIPCTDKGFREAKDIFQK